MNTPDLTIPAPAQPGRATRIAAVAVLITALALALTGAVALAANALGDDAGYFDSPTETFASSGYAIAMKSVDISDAPQWALNAGLDGIRVEAHGDRPLFLGIARAGDVDAYLRGTQHDDVAQLSYRPFQVDYDHADGSAPSQAPADESFWVESTGGAGTLALEWKPRPGNWRAVLMNADGSRGVTADLRFGARTSLLWWVGGGLLALGAVGTAVALLLRRAATRPRRSTSSSGL